MGRIIRSAAARADIEEIGSYIAQFNADAAIKVIEEFEAALYLLASSPMAGRARPELGKDLRSFPSRKYLLIYRAQPHGIELVRVLHGARDLRRLFRRKSS